MEPVHHDKAHHLIVFPFRQDLPRRFDLRFSAVLFQHVIIIYNSLNERLLKV